MSAGDNDAVFCREHAFAGNPLFRVSVVLATEQASRLTALYALFDLVRRIGSMAQEEGAARVQLEWWRQECLARDSADSSHPALRELTRGGHALDRRALAGLLEQAERRLEQPAMNDVASLRAFCEREGRPMLELELGLQGHGDVGRMPALAVRRGLWALLTDCFLQAEPAGPWWLPLDLLAREGVPRVEVLHAQRAPETQRIISDILAAVVGQESKEVDISDYNQIDNHAFLMDHLISGKQSRLRRTALRKFPGELSRVRVGEFLSTWSLARRLNRRK